MSSRRESLAERAILPPILIRHASPKPRELTKEGARKAVATMKRKGILSAKARKAWDTRRARGTTGDFETFALKLIAWLRTVPAGKSLEQVSKLEGFNQAKLRKLMDLRVLQEREGRYIVQEEFLDKFRQENLERKKKQIEEIEIEDYLENLEAQLAAKKRPVAGVA
ncbi:MAG: hypothetical protein HY247_08425 [archaeon]|nr:MAG: hypothetical protein HY247_08425 [archaeon]